LGRGAASSSGFQKLFEAPVWAQSSRSVRLRPIGNATFLSDTAAISGELGVSDESKPKVSTGTENWPESGTGKS
jgi:hypothetical protein